MANSIVLNKVNKRSITPTKSKPTLLERYYAFCDAEMKNRMVWFLLPLMSLSAAAMPISITIMYYYAAYPVYLAFVAFTILAFYANILATIAEKNTRVTITLYFITLALFTIIPIISFLL